MPDRRLKRVQVHLVAVRIDRRATYRREWIRKGVFQGVSDSGRQDKQKEGFRQMYLPLYAVTPNERACRARAG